MTNIKYPWWYIKIISEISSAEDVSQLSVWFAKFQYVIAVAIALEKKNGEKIKSWAMVFRALNTDFINDYMRPSYGRKWRDYSPKTFVLVIFFAQLFDCKVNDLLEFLRKDQCWRRIICGSDPVPRPSDISNFKRRVGEKRLIYCFQVLTGQIMGCMDFAEINDSFVLKHFAKEHGEILAFNKKNTALMRNNGLGLFMNFLWGVGVVNLIAGCLKRDKKKNGYEIRDLITTFLATNVLGVDNIFSLGFKIKNKNVRDVCGLDAAPHCTTLYLNFDNFNPEKLERLNEELVKRFWGHRRRKNGIIGIDSMILEIFGNYEGAEVGWDHVNNKSVRCYKLFAAFEVKSNYPVCFKIVPGNTSDSKMLVEMCDKAKKVVGKENIEIVMFDKGFYDAKSFNNIKDDLTFNTPAKKYKSIRDAIAGIEPEKFKQTSYNKWISETRIELDGYVGKLRLIVVKKVEPRVKKDKAAGEKSWTMEDVYYGYLTNNETLGTRDVPNLYSKRWGVENFFKELRNHWNIRNFPSTSLDAVRSHVALLFIQFLILSLFKHYVLSRKYRNAQLKTLRTQVFDVFEDESNGEITEGQYMEIVEFRNELRVYAKAMNCLFSLGTVGIPSIFY
ncbi:MAG: transposase [Methanophagales archaeon]|nr:transposase [Methanophagales archaeon]